MPTPLQTQATLAFAPDAGGDLQLVIEQETGRFFSDLDAHLLLFPAVEAQLSVDVGSVRFGINKTVDVAPGVVEFTGSSVARLPKIPSEATPEIRVLRASDANGNAKSIGISYDAGTGELRASAECIGAVAYGRYKTRAREIIYTPLSENLGGGSRTSYGTVVAFYPPRSQTVFQVQPFNVDIGQVQIELYRVVSNTVVNHDGEFEKPPNYPASNAYPGKALDIDISTSMETERVHEIGYIGQTGYAWVQPLHVRILEPYISDTAYEPAKRFIENTLDPKKYPADMISKAKNFIASRGFGQKGIPKG